MTIQPTMLTIAVVTALTSNAFVAAKEPLSIRVSPTVAFAPANLIVQSSIEPNASNRAVEIVADSDQFFRSSQVQLDGERAPRNTTFEFRSLPSGQYEVKAALIGVDGRPRAIVRAHVNVVESAWSQ